MTNLATALHAYTATELRANTQQTKRGVPNDAP